MIVVVCMDVYDALDGGFPHNGFRRESSVDSRVREWQIIVNEECRLKRTKEPLGRRYQREEGPPVRVYVCDCAALVPILSLVSRQKYLIYVSSSFPQPGQDYKAADAKSFLLSSSS